MRLWRCEFKFSYDPYLIARWFRATDAQSARILAAAWHGAPVVVIVTPERQGG